MLERVGIGYIGFFSGHCQDSHKPFLEATPCDVVGVADKVDPKDVRLPNMVDEPVLTTDYQELLDDDRVEAVIITTQDDTHFQIATDAIEAGKHVLVEKPATANAQQLAALPALFELAAAKAETRRLWVCHPREFGEGPWLTTAQLLGNPARISEVFEVGPMGPLREIRYDCHYTLPDRTQLHTSFADDKLNHSIVSALRSLNEVIGFYDATLLDNTQTYFDTRLTTISERDEQNGIVVRASGRRSAHKDYHGGGVYRDWVEAIFDEGVLRTEPSLGRIVLTYGKEERTPIEFDPSQLYNNMFSAFNTAFVRSVLNPSQPEPLTTQTKLLGTAAAILMQQPSFNDEVTEHAVLSLPREAP